MKIVMSLIAMLSIFSVQAGDKHSIAQWANSVDPLNVGSQAPNVILWTGNGDPIHLKKLLHKKATILMFYQGDWSPFCSDQLDQLQKIYKNLHKMGYQIVAISPDSPHKLIKSRKKKHLNYTLLSDYHLEAATAFGLAYRVSLKQAKHLKRKYGADLRRVKGEEQYNLPVPGVFIIDTKGKVHFQYANPEFKTQLTPGLLLEAAKMVAKNTELNSK